jgi:hypothetical protein
MLRWWYVTESFHTRNHGARLWVSYRLMNTFLGRTLAALLLTWIIGVQDRYKVTVRTFFNEKLLKYLPIDAGGNFFFPFHMYSLATFREYPKSQWSSFDLRSFFPHTDKFKLKVAICHDDLQLIKTILNRGFDVNAVIEEERCLTAIGMAAMLGKEQMVEYLVSRGADVNARDKEGNTPVMLSVVYDQPATLKKLVEMGAELKSKDQYGYTAMDKAVNRGREHLTAFLESVPQQSPQPLVHPITGKLESYDFLSQKSALQIVEKYQIAKYFRPRVYPYYKNTKGFLVYFFENFDLEDIEAQIIPSAIYNQEDDKASSDQQLFTFGEILRERNS